MDKRQFPKKGERLRNQIKEMSLEVYAFIPNPFGSFEKAKYTVCAGDLIFYSFVTTCRNTEDCIGIMKEKYRGKELPNKQIYLSIYKTVSEVKKLIFKGIVQ